MDRIKIVIFPHVLKDTDTLGSYNIKEGSSVHVISSTAPQANKSSPSQAHVVQNHQPVQPYFQQTYHSAPTFPKMNQVTSPKPEQTKLHHVVEIPNIYIGNLPNGFTEHDMLEKISIFPESGIKMFCCTAHNVTGFAVISVPFVEIADFIKSHWNGQFWGENQIHVKDARPPRSSGTGLGPNIGQLRTINSPQSSFNSPSFIPGMNQMTSQIIPEQTEVSQDVGIPNIYIGNLPNGFSNDEMKEKLSIFPEFEIKMLRSNAPDKSGFAIVSVPSVEIADYIKSHWNGQTWGENQIIVDDARPPKPKVSTGGKSRNNRRRNRSKKVE
ncbi:hypothetical protein GEMRC1_007396 [Eukaryota sp. GEM-RC1]